MYSQNLKNYYQNIVLYDLSTKLNYENIFKIVKINQIYLNMGSKDLEINKKKLITILVFLKLITNQTSFTTKSKKNIIFLKIKKGSIIGCKITLRKKNMYLFLEKLLFFIFSNEKIKINLKNHHIINFQIKNLLNFFEFKQEFLRFNKLPALDISIHTNSNMSQHINLLFQCFFFNNF